jgi:hypothetical protein
MAAERWRRVLGWSQLICGLLAIAILPWAAGRMPSITNPGSYIAGTLVYVGLTALAGIGLLRRSDWSVPLSACVQIPQLFWVANPSFLFKFVCGLMLLIQLTPGDLSFRAGFEVSAWLGRNPGPEQHFYVLNLFPILALRGLWRLRRSGDMGGPDVPTVVTTGSRSADTAA